jgi:hypothetical protein
MKSFNQLTGGINMIEQRDDTLNLHPTFEPQSLPQISVFFMFLRNEKWMEN